MHSKKGILCLFISLTFVLYLVSPLIAAQPLINFQGRLTDQQGNPLNGTYDIKFSIYPSDPNAEPLWTEEHTDVGISNGIVNVLLGSKTSFDEPVKVTFDEERYLGITIDCDHDPNTKDPEMTPRQKILPAIYSYDADKLDGKDGSEYSTPQTDAGRPGVVDLAGYIPIDICYVKDVIHKDYVCPYKSESGIYRQEEGILYCPLFPFLNSVLSSISGKYRRITSFNTCEGAMLYDTDIPEFVNTLYYLDPKYGFWIKMLDDGRLIFP